LTAGSTILASTGLACPEHNEGVFAYDPQRGWIRTSPPEKPENTLFIFINIFCRHACNELLNRLREKARGSLGRNVEIYLVVCTRFHKVCSDAAAESLFHTHDIIASPAIVLYLGGRQVVKLQGSLRIERELDKLVSMISLARAH